GVSALTASVGKLACAIAAWLGVFTRARIATRTCDGRPLAGAGVNLKSVSERLLPARAAASFGSALAGVNEDKVSKLSDTAGGRFFVLVAANAGVSTRPTAASAAASLASLFEASLNNRRTPCSRVDIISAS